MVTESEHAFTAGALSLCFVDTFGDRGGAGVERIRNTDDLRTWLELAGLVARAGRPPTKADLQRAHRLREAIHAAASASVRGDPIRRDDLWAINEAAARPPLRPQMIEGELRYVAKNAVAAALSTIAADAIELFTAGRRDRIRICPECRMIFIDQSRPGKRRWCSSNSGCGNRAKVRRHRARKHAPSEEQGQT
jgi:predicted RNA-binding Zn ribbon-like protein